MGSFNCIQLGRGHKRYLKSLTLASLLLLLLFCDSVRCATLSPDPLKFKPSLAELTVPFRENPKIVLANFPGHAVVIPLMNGQVSASNYLVHVARQAGHSDAGHFFVEAPKGYGVMAVIQRLYLRRISDNHSLLHLVNNCKDFLEFEGQNEEKTIPICGSLDKDDDSFYPNNLHGPKFFNSNNGRMKVTFRNHYNYGNDVLSSTNDSHVQHNQEMLTAEIAFTAFSRCETSTTGRFHCTHDKCIDQSLACDKIEHCAPGENEGRVGYDEKNCSHSRHEHRLFDPIDPNDDFPSLFSGESVDDPSVVIVPSDDADLEEFGEESKLPNVTTIIVLVVIMSLITICGYFWGWLSQFCCVARNIRRSADVRDSGSPGSSPSRIVTESGARSHNTNCTSRRPMAYYVPTVVLRPLPGANGVSVDDQPTYMKTFAKQEPLDNPPAYDMLFPQEKSDSYGHAPPSTDESSSKV